MTSEIEKVIPVIFTDEARMTPKDVLHIAGTKLDGCETCVVIMADDTKNVVVISSQAYNHEIIGWLEVAKTVASNYTD